MTSLRIAVLATNRNPLSEPFAGGQESLTAALVAGFRRRGHHVVLFAAEGTPADVADEVVAYPALPRFSAVAALDPQLPEKPFLDDHHAFTFAAAELARRDRAGELDVVANHSLHHLPMSLSRAYDAPVVTTLHTPPFPWMELGAALASPASRFVAVSKALAAQWSTLTRQVVANGVDESRFVLGPGADDGRLAWVGRITPEKAPHLAIDAARVAGRRLALVGPVSDAAYFEAEIAPRLGGDVEHLGAVRPDEVAKVVGRGLQGRGVGAELAGDGEPQGVGPAPGQVLFLLGDAVGRAHGPARQLAAGAVVVAHFNCARHAAPFRPVEGGLHGLRDGVVRREAHQGAVVHAQRPDDLAGVEAVVRVEAVLHRLEGAGQARPEHRRDVFRARDAVAVLA